MAQKQRRVVMGLPRLTVRQWMLVVAVAALVMMQVEFLRRCYVYMNVAESYETRAEGARIRRKAEDRFGVFPKEMFDADGQMKAENAAMFELLRVYFEAMGRKYRYAAAHPWLSVDPDPPILTME
jgi:hypothetical protein